MQTFSPNARVVAPDGQHGAVVQQEGVADNGDTLYSVIFDDGVSAGIFLSAQLTAEVI